MSRGIFLAAAAVAAILVVAIAVFLEYRRDIGAAREAVGSGSRIVQTALGPVEYAEQGEGAVLLSIHGAGGGYDQGLALAADLAGPGYRIIAPSRFGYLAAPLTEDTSTEAQADVLAAFLDELQVPNAVVLGTSAGALTAIELAISHPGKVAALILMVPAGYSPGDPVTIEENRGNRITFWVVNNGADFTWWALEKIMPSVLYRFVGVEPGLVERAGKDEQARVNGIIHAIQPLSMRFSGIQVDSTNKPRERPFESISAPTLIVSAEDDLFNTAAAARYAASRIPGARLAIFENGGHLLVGRQQQTRDLVGEFLAGTGG